MASALFNLGEGDETRTSTVGLREHISKQNAYSPLGKDLSSKLCVLVCVCKALLHF